VYAREKGKGKARERGRGRRPADRCYAVKRRGWAIDV
jgi:hypothetical protein